MTIVADAFEKAKLEHVNYNTILQFTNIPRLKFEKYFVEAVNLGLLKKDILSNVTFTDKGLSYAEDHGLAG